MRVAKTFNEVMKFNPYHGADGRFSSASGAKSFTYAPGKSKAHDLAIEREKARTAGTAGGTQSYTPSKMVKQMMGDEHTKEYDTGNHPNKYKPDDPRWGTEPGSYTVYRAGNLNRGVIFTASDYDGSKNYADAFPKSDSGAHDPKRSAVYTYTVDVKKPFVSKDMPDAYEKLFGKKPNLQPSAAQIRKGVTTGDLWVKADDQIAKKLTQKGYDAWTMTNPAPPAKKEMNILGAGRAAMQETGRKIPQYVKDQWQKEADKGGYWAHSMKNGAATMTVSEWFQTSDYKAGKAEGRWP